MLSVNMADVVKVVQSCLPYLTGFAVVAVNDIIEKIVFNKK